MCSSQGISWMRKAKEQGADLVAPWLQVQTGTHMGQIWSNGFGVPPTQAYDIAP